MPMIRQSLLLGAAAAALCCVKTVSGNVGLAQDAAKNDAAAGKQDFSKFMPKPTGHGFDDTGMTRGAEFDKVAQMGRFGIPDLNNPVTKELTDLDFEVAMGDNEYLAVLFYAPTMTEYEYVALHWEKASMEMDKSIRVFTTANITMARFDISEPEHGELASLYEVTTRPVMKMFRAGKFLSDINCPIQHDEIRQFIVAQTLPSVEVIETEKMMGKWKRRKAVNQANLKFLGYFTDETADARKDFEALGKKFRQKIQFAVTSDSKLFETATKTEKALPGAIMFLRDFDSPKQIPYTGPLQLAEIVSFIRKYNLALLTNMGDREEFRVRDFMEHSATYRLMAFYKSQEHFEKYEESLKSLAREIRDDALVGYTIEQEDDGSNFDYTFWEVTGKEPTVLYYHAQKDRKYTLSGPDALEKESIQQFLRDIEAGKISPKLKSQVAPATNTGPTRVVVTTTYDEDIYENTDEDSLVLFYMPHHRDSDWFVDQIEKFAKVWRREKRLTVSTVDCAQNDIVHVDPPRLPMLYYVSANMKKSGARKTEDTLPTEVKFPDMKQLMEFVKSHTSFSDLKQDQKIWDILLKEDEEIYARLNAEKDGAKAKKEKVAEKAKEEKNAGPKLDGLFGSDFEKLREKMLKEEAAREAEDKEDASPEFTGTAAQKNQFPGSFKEIKSAQDLINGEVKQLLKSTGFKMPKDFDDTFDPEKIAASFTWYNALYLGFNMALTSVFGSGYIGALVMILLLSSIFIGLPMAWKLYRKNRMKSWLVKFYEEHQPSHLDRVDTIVDAYVNMSNGMNMMKADLVKKYVLETKKTK